MRNMLVRSRETDIEHILENIVYLELKRRYPEVYVGQWGSDREVDFVAIRDGNLSYFQVAQTTLDEVFDVMDYDGIKKMNALKWMYQ